MFKYMNLHKLHGRAYMEEAGGDGGDGGGGAGPAPIDPAQFAALQESVTAQQKAMEKLEANNKTLLQEKIDAKKAADAAAQEAAKARGDLDAYAESLRKTEFEPMRAENDQLRSALDEATIGMVIKDIEKDVFISSKVDHGLKSRLSREVVDGKAIVRVLDKEGRPSAQTIEQLKDEYRNDPDYAPFVIGSKANGSGPVGGKGNPAAKIMKRSDFEAMGAGDQKNFTVRDKGVIID